MLIEKIEQFTRKYYANRLLQGVLVGAALWMFFYLLLTALEYFSWFSSNVRFVLLLLLIAGSLGVFVFYFFLPLLNLFRFRKKMSVEHAALMIGRFFPDIQDKLLNTVQLTQELSSSPSNALLVAAIEQRTAQLSPVRFTDAVDLKGNLKYLWFALGLLLLLLGLVLFLPHFAVLPAQRIIHYEQHYDKPLPFTVELSDASFETNQGSDVTISIHVTGSRIPDAFYVRSALGQQLMLKSSVNDYSYVFRNVYNDFSFQVVGGDYASAPVSVTVHANPVLLSYECRVLYPAYIHRSSEVFEAKTRVLVPQGSKLDYTFSLRDADSAYLLQDSSRISLPIHDGDAHYSLTAASSCSMDFYCSNDYSSKFDPLKFSVDVLPDAYPDIHVESFDEALSTEVYYSGLIADDYGFSKLTFNAVIKEPVERQVSLPVLFDKSQTRTSFFYRFDMDSLGVLPGQSMEVYFMVWDNDGFHGPKSKRSETFSYYKPSKNTLDSIAEQTENDIMDKMSARSDEAEKLKDDIEKMLRDLASKKELDWSDKEKVKELLQKQSQIEQDWNHLQEEQQKLSDFMKDHDMLNEDLLKKQEKINELFNELIPDELKKMMEEIEKLLDEMPRDKMQEMLRDMKKDNQKMQDLLDRNLSLLEQLRMEKGLNDLMDQLNKLGDELENQEKADEKSSNENPSQAENTPSAEEAKERFEELMQTLDSLMEKNKTLTDPFSIQKDNALQDSINQDLDDAAQAEQNQQDASSDADEDSSDDQSQEGGSESSPQNEASQKKQKAGQKMKQMASSMMMSMMSGGDEQLAEDAHLVRILLENVVRSSHQQEDLMRSLGSMRSDDPSITDKIVRQKELSDNFVLVKDSLRAMALRQPMIKNYIFDELETIDNQLDVSLKYLNDLHLSVAVGNQQVALQSMNNLALMLAESLNEMESSMSGSGSSGRSKPKPGQSQQSIQQMKDLQQKLGEQLKQMQQQMNQPNGQMNGMSEELARMAAEQEMIRQGMQQMLDQMKKDGQLGDDGINQIMKDMELLEEDLVNKRVTNKTIERNRDIISRMLESEKAQQKRDQDEKRKSREFKGSQFGRQVEELYYERNMRKSMDFLKLDPIQYQPYYKSKINDYYLKTNQQ